MKFLITLFLLIANIGFAKDWTGEKEFSVDFSQTDINPNDVKVTFEYYCNYSYKFIDIIQGRIGEATKSCGNKIVDLKILNGKIKLPPISQFDHRKGDDLSRYGMQVKLDWNGRNLLWISTGNQQIQTFYNSPYELRFEQFKLNDLEITFEGINIIDHPEFKAEKTEVTTYFYVKRTDVPHYMLDTDLTRSFKVFSMPFTYISRNDPTKLGKISLETRYHAFLNNENLEVQVDIHAKDKNNQFVTADLIKIPLSQDAIDQIKSVEIKRK